MATDWERVETAADFIFLGPKITVGGDCSHEIKRYLLLERKAMTNLYSILKSRDITLLTKVHLVKALVFFSTHVRCAGIKIARRNISNLRYTDDTSLMAESEEGLKSLLMKVKEENEIVGLKLNIQKTKIMASSPITSWQIDGETVEAVRDFILGDSKITADGDCSHEIKRRLLLERKAITNLYSILKSRHYFTNKGPTSQSYGFSSSHVWM